MIEINYRSIISLNLVHFIKNKVKRNSDLWQNFSSFQWDQDYTFQSTCSNEMKSHKTIYFC